MKAIRTRRPKYDVNHPYDPDLATALCFWCATLFLHPLDVTQGGWLKMSKCPDCGSDDLRRLPHFTHPKFKRKWLRNALVEIQRLAYLSCNKKTNEKGFDRIIPPGIIIKKGRRSRWHGGWEWQVITGPEWLGEAKGDPHRSKEEKPVVRVATRMVVPSLIWTPPKFNIIKIGGNGHAV